MSVAKIAVDCGVYHLDQNYDYRIPPEVADRVLPGVRVTVPFGRANRAMMGMVISLSDTSELKELKDIDTVLDDEPIIDGDLLQVALFVRDRCFCTLFDALRVMLPEGVRYSLEQVVFVADPLQADLSEDERTAIDIIRQMKKPTMRRVTTALGSRLARQAAALIRKGALYAQMDRIGLAEETMRTTIELAVSHEEASEYVAQYGNRRVAQAKVVSVLLNSDVLTLAEVCYLAGVSQSVVRALAKNGIIMFGTKRQIHRPYQKKRESLLMQKEAIELSDEQQEVVDGVKMLLERAEPSVALLHGITGSGKTLCYLLLVEHVIALGGGALVLVPEIVLTPQLTDRFFSHFGSGVAVLHSRLSAAERRDEWLRIRKAECPVVIGTRSAVFAPIPNLRMIVMDEEHEYAYKSESSPRYHARTIAKLRVTQAKGVLLLCSATPSIESYAAAIQGRHHLFSLQNRHADAQLPRVVVTNLRDELSAGLSPVTGPTLIHALREILANGKQGILFLNRRGYNTFLGCRTCGAVLQCERCSISMTYHNANKLLMCHYCAAHREVPVRCPSCGHETLSHRGFGTQRVEEEINRLLPHARTLRMDRDTTSTKMSYDEMLYSFAAREYDVLIGTQMVTKGLDLPDVALVGILFADSLLYTEDFRAGERAFSLLTQVAGRAGRAGEQGCAIIETFEPGNRIVSMARNQDYKSFYESEIAFRSSAAYPPFCDIYVVSFSAQEEELSRSAAFFFLKEIREHFQSMPGHSIIIYPVTQSPIFRINTQCRHRFILKCNDSVPIRNALATTLRTLMRCSDYSKVTCSVDLNPYNMT